MCQLKLHACVYPVYIPATYFSPSYYEIPMKYFPFSGRKNFTRDCITHRVLIKINWTGATVSRNRLVVDWPRSISTNENLTFSGLHRSRNEIQFSVSSTEARCRVAFTVECSMHMRSQHPATGSRKLANVSLKDSSNPLASLFALRPFRFSVLSR